MLLQGATVATGYPVSVFRADILVERSQISKVGQDLVPADGATCIDCSRMLITPGFVNGHIHLNQVLNRGELDELSTEDLLSAMHARHDAKTDTDRYWGSLLSIAEALSCGTTYFSSFASGASLIGQAMHDAGIRGTLTIAKKDQWWGDGHPPEQNDTGRIIAGLETALAKWSFPRVSLSIGAASDRSASEGLLCGVRRLATDAGCRIYMHVAEGAESLRLSILHRGRSPIAYLSDIGFLGKDLTLVHACQVDAQEIALIAAAGSSVCHCPVSNAKTAAGAMPLEAFMEAHVPICLGTDSASTGNTNNVLLEGYMASLLHKCRTDQAAFPDAQEIFALLTLKGARAVGMEGKIGEVAAGMKADLALWDLDQPAFLPDRGDPVSTLVYCASEVRASKVIIDGRLVYDRVPLDFSLNETVQELARYSQKA